MRLFPEDWNRRGTSDRTADSLEERWSLNVSPRPVVLGCAVPTAEGLMPTVPEEDGEAEGHHVQPLEGVSVMVVVLLAHPVLRSPL